MQISKTVFMIYNHQLLGHGKLLHKMVVKTLRQ